MRQGTVPAGLIFMYQARRLSMLTRFTVRSFHFIPLSHMAMRACARETEKVREREGEEREGGRVEREGERVKGREKAERGTERGRETESKREGETERGEREQREEESRERAERGRERNREGGSERRRK